MLHTCSRKRCYKTPFLYQDKHVRLSLAGQEPSQPVPLTAEESPSQTFQRGMQFGFDEVAETPEFHPLKSIHQPFHGLQLERCVTDGSKISSPHYELLPGLSITITLNWRHVAGTYPVAWQATRYKYIRSFSKGRVTVNIGSNAKLSARNTGIELVV